MVLLVAAVLALPAGAMEFEAPQAPDSVRDFLPEQADSFAGGLWNVLRYAVRQLSPSLTQAAESCIQVGAMLLLCTLVGEFAPGISRKALDLAGVVGVSSVLLGAAVSLIRLGEQTVAELSEYGKLLLPVMAGALAAQGGMTASTALYVGTAAFDAALSGILHHLMIPVLYLYLALGIACGAMEQPMLEKLKTFVKWAAGWILKLVLYGFTGYMTITGAVSGAADATAVKAAKIAISGAVPVVGGILADASETVLVSAGMMGSGAGVYGLLTVLALFSVPFFQMGTQYLLLKCTAALGAAFGSGGCIRMVEDFSAVMGLLLAMVSTQTVLLLISTVCFMKGVG